VKEGVKFQGKLMRLSQRNILWSQLEQIYFMTGFKNHEQSGSTGV